MNEFELLARLIPRLTATRSVVVGAGDDCAVLETGMPDHWLLFKTDAVVEGVHFTADSPPEKVGWKALARCLSDIAAMGGTPTAALVTLGLKSGFDPRQIEALYGGLNRCAAQYGVAICGGETTTLPERMLISISLLGQVEKGRAIRRAGARVGDAIFVTGELGGSLHGKHLDFEPRLAEARWLTANFQVHSMIDVSDGIAGDLRHILNASGVGAELLSSAVPISRVAKLAAKEGHGKGPALLRALTDGEDFELLFTVKSGDAVALLDGWRQQFPNLRLSCIGRITSERRAVLRDKDGFKPLPEHGYVHFA